MLPLCPNVCLLPSTNTLQNCFTDCKTLYRSCSLPQKVIGVFKPKSEEPYGHLNPKWTKYFHKVLCHVLSLREESERKYKLLPKSLPFCLSSLTSCAVRVVSAEAACCLTRVTSRRLLPHWWTLSSPLEWCPKQRRVLNL